MISDFTNVYLVRLRFTFTFCKKKKLTDLALN